MVKTGSAVSSSIALALLEEVDGHVNSSKNFSNLLIISLVFMFVPQLIPPSPFTVAVPSCIGLCMKEDGCVIMR